MTDAENKIIDFLYKESKARNSALTTPGMAESFYIATAASAETLHEFAQKIERGEHLGWRKREASESVVEGL